MRYQSSAIARAAIAIREFWRDGVYLQEKLLERPWEREGELQWRRGPGGPELVGRGLNPVVFDLVEPDPEIQSEPRGSW